MTVIDANLLLYALQRGCTAAARGRRVAAQSFAGRRNRRPSMVTIWAFIRICTNPRIWSNPLSAKKAFAIIGEWIAQPGVVVVQPGPRHAQIVERLVMNMAQRAR